MTYSYRLVPPLFGNKLRKESSSRLSSTSALFEKITRIHSLERTSVLNLPRPGRTNALERVAFYGLGNKRKGIWEKMGKITKMTNKKKATKRHR